jgi:pyrrolidone-carboxylate peptidase
MTHAYIFSVKHILTISAIALAGCLSSGEAPVEDADVRVDTSTKIARAQYDANVAFANAYRPTCAAPANGPRVLLTGFGRFMGITNNATGRIVSALVRSAVYPETVPAPEGQVDPAGPQLSVGTETLMLAKSGAVQVCAMILPVYWDLAPILIAKEVQAFKPDLVLMNGVAGGTQPLWFEMGAINEAQTSEDGSEHIRPIAKPGQSTIKVVDSDSAAFRPLLASWGAMKDAAHAAIAANADVLEDGTAFSKVLTGTRLAPFPRTTNTYLCNNVTYVTNYLLDNPGKRISLLQASKKVIGKPNDVAVALTGDFSKVSREFIHWPSELRGKHVDAAARVIAAVIDAELGGRAERGDNAKANSDLSGGDTF